MTSPQRSRAGAWTFRGGLTFTAAGAVQKGLPILLLPIYAKALPAVEYGQIALLVAATAVLGSILGFGLEASVVRETVRLASNRPARQRFLNSIGWFTLLVPFSTAVGVWAGVAVLGGPDFDNGVVLVALISVAIQSTSTVFVGAALRAEERLGAYLAVTLTNALATAVFTIGFLSAFKAGPAGWFGGAASGGMISLAVGLALLGHVWTRDVSWSIIKGALLFGIPLLPHMLAHWVLNLSDRLIIGAYSGEEAVGAYSLAYQAAAPIMLVLVALHQTVMPLYPRAAEDESTRRRLTHVLTGHVYVGIWLAMACAMVAPPVMLALFPADYVGAASFIPWIAIGYVLYGLYLIPTDSMTLMLGRTHWLWIATGIAAVINLGLNLAFVPAGGPNAAAVATAVGYAALLAGAVIMRQRMRGVQISYQSRAMIIGALWCSVLAGVGLFAFPDSRAPSDTLGRVILVAIAGTGLLWWYLRRHARSNERWDPDAAAHQPATLEAGDSMSGSMTHV